MRRVVVVALRRSPKALLPRSSTRRAFATTTSNSTSSILAPTTSLYSASHQYTKQQQQHDATISSYSLGSLSDACSFGMLLRRQQHFSSSTITNNTPRRNHSGIYCVRWHSTAAASTPSSSSLTPFLLADIGEGIAEVELLQWFVQEGDYVNEFDRICEVQSDKATVEITSRYEGYITSLDHTVGDMVKVGSPLLFLQGGDDEGDEDTASSTATHHHHHQADEVLLRDRSSQASVVDPEPLLNIPTIASQYHLQTDDDHDKDYTSRSNPSSSRGAGGISPDLKYDTLRPRSPSNIQSITPNLSY
jgi:hypothetical protein